MPPRPAPLPGAVDLAAFFEEALHVIDGFILAAEHERHQALGIELHHHVRAFVDDPQVVVLVEADGVGEGEAVGVLAPLLDELVGLVELEQLGRLRAARRADVAAARVDEQVLLGIERDADGFADGVPRGHQRQRDRVVLNLRGVLFEFRLCRQRGLPFRGHLRRTGRRLCIEEGGADHGRRECQDDCKNGVLHMERNSTPCSTGI